MVTRKSLSPRYACYCVPNHGDYVPYLVGLSFFLLQYEAKRSESMLDSIDSHILRRLAQNSRISYTDLAKEVGLSGVAVKERIDRLVNQGIIEQFSIVISAEKLGKKISAYLELEVEPAHLNQIVDVLKQSDRVAVLYEMTGPCILHIHILVESIEEMEQFMNESIYSLEGIVRAETQILMKRHKNQDGLNI